MFKVRRRAGAAAAGSDLPYCPMCQQSIRIDAATGRCALGHRATVPAASVATADVAPTAVTSEVSPTVADTPVDGGYDPGSFDPYDTIVYGRATEYDYATANSASAAWDAPAAGDDHAEGVLTDYATWGEPGNGLSALDVDTEQLPTQPVPAQAAAGGSGLFDGMDDEDDATHARRKAVGTVAGTIVASGMVFAAVAVLPF